MSEPSKPPLDVDALARRLPRREPSRERALAIRRALLETAELPSRSSIWGAQRGWFFCGAGALAVAACALIAWHTLARPGPAPVRATASVAPPPPPESEAEVQAGSATTGEPLADGVTTVEARRPMQLVRADTTITATAGARFSVDVREGRVQLVTVQAGWVVIAAAHVDTKMVVARQTWTLPAAAAPPTAAATPPTAATPRAMRSASSTPVAESSPATKPRPAAPRDTPPPSATPPPPRAAVPAAASASERDFRDGLRALLAGDPHKAIAALDRACDAPSSAQADVCYWSAVAWLRTGERVRARRGFEDVLIRFPGATHAGEANVALGWLLLDAGDRPAARARFAEAARDSMPSVRAEAVRGLAAAR